MDQQAPIAILLFSRSAESEFNHKKWLGSKFANKAIANHLIQTTKQHLAAAALPVFHFDESHQNGHTFGEKLANAFQEVFGLGYQAVISVGNDAPGLREVDWQQVKGTLSSGRNVIGPDFRKGAYLIGLTRESFHKKSFENLSWQTNLLFDELYEYSDTPALLTKSRDLNSSFDLELEAQQNAQLKKLVRLLNFVKFPTGSLYDKPYLQLLTKDISVRAPPRHTA